MNYIHNEQSLNAYEIYDGNASPISLVLTKAIVLYFLLSILFSFWAVPFRSLNTSGSVEALSLLLPGIVWSWLLYRYRKEIGGKIGGWIDATGRLPPWAWTGVCVAAGIMLRAIWGLSLQGEQLSDSATYLGLAKQLAFEGWYGTFEGWYGSAMERAHWAPGTALFLSSFLWVLGDGIWVPFLANILLFAGTVATSIHLGRIVGGERVGRLAGLLLVVWPSHVFLTWFVTKELLPTFLIPFSIWLYLLATSTDRRGRSCWLVTAAGAAIGFAALCQPSLMLLPAAFVVYEVSRGSALRRWAVRVLLLLIAAAAVISLWTIRNFVVLGAFVLISTNGGTSLYLGNHPGANGYTYNRVGDPIFDETDELKLDTRAREAAINWILANPKEFLKLVVNRHTIYLGGDNIGAHWSLFRGRDEPGAPYVAAKIVSQIFWVAILSLMGLALARGKQLLSPPGRHTALLVLVFLYGLTVDGISLAAQNHHIGFYGIMAVLAALCVFPGADSAVGGRRGASATATNHLAEAEVG